MKQLTDKQIESEINVWSQIVQSRHKSRVRVSLFDSLIN